MVGSFSVFLLPFSPPKLQSSPRCSRPFPYTSLPHPALKRTGQSLFYLLIDFFLTTFLVVYEPYNPHPFSRLSRRYLGRSLGYFLFLSLFFTAAQPRKICTPSALASCDRNLFYPTHFSFAFSFSNCLWTMGYLIRIDTAFPPPPPDTPRRGFTKMSALFSSFSFSFSLYAFIPGKPSFSFLRTFKANSMIRSLIFLFPDYSPFFLPLFCVGFVVVSAPFNTNPVGFC